MGIYDESIIDRGKVVLGVLILLLAAEIYFLLPPPTGANLKTDKPVYTRGGNGVLWVEVYNLSSSPLTGVLVSSDAPDGEVELNYSPHLLTVPPRGAQTLKIPFTVDENASYGDHLLRVFVSFPGETRVVYKRVKVG